MNSDEKDDLWHLLGKAKQVNPSPFFARNILREIRATSKPSLLASLVAALCHKLPRKSATASGRRYSHWLTPTASACALILILLGLQFTVISPRPKDREIIQQLAASGSDVEVITHLDDLLASEETSLWTDSLSD